MALAGKITLWAGQPLEFVMFKVWTIFRYVSCVA